MCRLTWCLFFLHGHVVILNCSFVDARKNLKVTRNSCIKQHAHNLASKYALDLLKTYTHRNGDEMLVFVIQNASKLC